MPEALLLGAAIASLHVDAFREPMRQFAPFAPIVVFGLGFLLALRFQRSRLVFALVILALVEWGLDRTRAGDVGRFVWQASAVLLPLNFAAVMLMTERGIFTRTGLARIAILLAQVAGLAAVARYAPHRAESIVSYQAFPPEWFSWTPLGQPALLAFLVGATLIITGIVFRASTTGRAFLWALVAAFLAMHSVDTPVAARIYGSTAGLILVVAVIEASYLMAYQDGLTGLPARRALTEALQQVNGKFTIAMVDVDHFKKLNDRYGHDVGDQLLRMAFAALGRPGRRRRHQAVVVQPHQGDHVAHVVIVLDAARRRADGVRKHRMRHDPAPLPQLGPHILGQAEVSGAIAMQVTDLPAPHLEGELAAGPPAGLDTRPRRDLLSDSLAGSLSGAHVFLGNGMGCQHVTSSSELEVRGHLHLACSTWLPHDAVPTIADWSRLTKTWRTRIDERIAELERLKDGLTECIGCGCLSLDRFRLANPGDRAAARGPGPRYWIGSAPVEGR